MNDCAKSDDTITCSTCNRTCRSLDCYNIHKAQRPAISQGKRKGQCRPPLCKTFWKCPKCTCLVEWDDKETHDCSDWFCKSCQTLVSGEHLCYLRYRAPKDHIEKLILKPTKVLESISLTLSLLKNLVMPVRTKNVVQPLSVKHVGIAVINVMPVMKKMGNISNRHALGDPVEKGRPNFKGKTL